MARIAVTGLPERLPECIEERQNEEEDG